MRAVNPWTKPVIRDLGPLTRGFALATSSLSRLIAAFSLQVKTDVFGRAGGRCVCIDEHLDYSNPPHPGGRCPQKHNQENFYFVNKASGISGTETGTAAECVMLCSDCRDKFKAP